MSLLLLAALAHGAEASPWSLTLVGGVGTSAAPPSLGAHAVGRVWLGLGNVGIEAAGREGYAADDARTVGAIFIGGHAFLPRGTFLRLGFAHHHETPWANFLDKPGLAFAGTDPSITHRSGAELGGGIDVKLPDAWPLDPIGLVLDLSVSAFPDSAGSPVYVWFEQSWSLHVRDRVPATE